MFIESRFYDNGSARMKLHVTDEYPQTEESNAYDLYIEEITNLEDYIENNLEIDYDDMIPMILALNDGEWVNITNYC